MVAASALLLPSLDGHGEVVFTAETEAQHDVAMGLPAQ